MENTLAADIFETTRLLKAWSEGDETALERLVPLVDAELRRLARHYLRQERPDHILQTTALVNEAWVRLINWPDVSWQNRAHFIGLAAQLMRRVLVDEARRRQAQKYGADAVHVSLADAEGIAHDKGADLVALDDALNELGTFDTLPLMAYAISSPLTFFSMTAAMAVPPFSASSRARERRFSYR